MGEETRSLARAAPSSTYAALDLGTNNCRLLIARPAGVGFRVVDSFSRIVRLGEGLASTGRLGEAAIARTLDALTICSGKMRARGVTRSRLIATEACRAADNGDAFVRAVRDRTGLALEIIDRHTEATLATAGCGALADDLARGVLLFDIGGGSSEVVWLAPAGPGGNASPRILHWTSLRLGVVTLAERFGGRAVDDALFGRMVEHVADALAGFVATLREVPRCPRFHLLGTSGTVTTMAGVFLGLARYDRRLVDGLRLSSGEIDAALALVRAMSYDERAAHGCIGVERADLVLAGCAIFQAIRRAFPAPYLRVADRGLREGLLMGMMAQDGARGRGPAIGVQ